MQYRKDKIGKDLSILGLGCMRFPQKGGKIDLDETEKVIKRACELGINYFDTAYIYPGSESALGEITERCRIRDKINIATKLPHYMLKHSNDADKYFLQELERLRTDHVDYYLIHMLNDIKAWERLCSLNLREWIDSKKKSGAIGQIGFSYHGNSDTFCQIIDAYDWDFCQIQYNYMDENSQAGKTGLQYAASKGIPVIIMEPLRGGRLVNNLPEKAEKLFSAFPEKRSAAEWSLRWLWNQPEVTCVLSGMNSVQMTEENAKSADISRIGAFSQRDEDLLSKVVAAINEKMKVGCTGCRYCMPCPQKVDIPGTFAAYNRRYSDGIIVSMREYIMCTVLRSDSTSASCCIGCGKCEQHCPQHIDIRSELKNARRVLENPVYKAAAKIIPLFMKY